jgi:mRNA interferase MazF
MIQRGDVVLLSFPFTDLSGTKVRPAILVSDDSFNRQGDDGVFVCITTQKYQTPFDLSVTKSSSSFRATGLKENSTVRVSKIMCLDKGLVRRRLGSADSVLMKKIQSALKCLLAL